MSSSLDFAGGTLEFKSKLVALLQQADLVLVEAGLDTDFVPEYPTTSYFTHWDRLEASSKVYENVSLLVKVLDPNEARLASAQLQATWRGQAHKPLDLCDWRLDISHQLVSAFGKFGADVGFSPGCYLATNSLRRDQNELWLKHDRQVYFRFVLTFGEVLMFLRCYCCPASEEMRIGAALKSLQRRLFPDVIELAALISQTVPSLANELMGSSMKEHTSRLRDEWKKEHPPVVNEPLPRVPKPKGETYDNLRRIAAGDRSLGESYGLTADQAASLADGIEAYHEGMRASRGCGAMLLALAAVALSTVGYVMWLSL